MSTARSLEAYSIRWSASVRSADARPWRFLAQAVLLLSLTLTACSAGEEGKSSTSPIKAGTCIAKEIPDEDDKAPDLSSVVDCSEPHVYEIVDVVDLPKQALTGETRDERLANRKDLATSDLDEGDEVSPEYEALDEFIAQGACNAGLLDRTGYTNIEVNGVNARDARLNPLFSTIQVGRSNVMPEDEWLEGDRRLICSVRFVEPLKDYDTQFSTKRALKPVSSKNNEPVLASAGTAAFPAAWRECTAFAKGEEFGKPSGCDRQHYSETLFAFDAQKVMERALLKSVDEDNPSEKHLADFARVCRTSLSFVMAEGFDESTSKGRVRVRGVTGVPWNDDAKFVLCELAGVPAKTTDLGPGSLVWTDASQAKLIDVG